MSETICVLVEREGEWWVSQCLQIGVATQAKSLEEIYSATWQLVESHFERAREHGIDAYRSKADRSVWELFEESTLALTPADDPSIVPGEPFPIRTVADKPVRLMMRLTPGV